jgi:hypothetical protein
MTGTVKFTGKNTLEMIEFMEEVEKKNYFSP